MLRYSYYNFLYDLNRRKCCCWPNAVWRWYMVMRLPRLSSINILCCAAFWDFMLYLKEHRDFVLRDEVSRRLASCATLFEECSNSSAEALSETFGLPENRFLKDSVKYWDNMLSQSRVIESHSNHHLQIFVSVHGPLSPPSSEKKVSFIFIASSFTCCN